MARLARFEEHRFIGTRDDMRVFDADDDAQFEILSARVATDDLMVSRGLQTFAPDSLAQARNQGFRPV
ncbi:hypothetical protein MNBD_ACTINO01-2547 [hydrothermal vent metagenome]|uniref:Uncharacterized protein n=1 Tax=hydrothermal vent metagenome TaxID=652676 RepID=A0A3B0SRF9_9ZZZZ